MSLSINYPPDLGLSSLLANTRVVPAEKVEDLQHLGQLTEAAEQRIQRAEQHCLQQIDAVRQQAWDDGYQSGMAAASEKTMTILQQADKRSANSEAELVGLALETVRALLGELPADIITPALAQQALRTVCEQHARVVVLVHPHNRAALQQRLQESDAGASRGVQIKVQEDASLDRRDCRLETELGSVQAGLEIQFAAIERALKSELNDA